jgi:hypothetical protein
MVSLRREPCDDYSVRTELVEIRHLKRDESTLPDRFVTASGNGITEEYLDWLAPLVGTLPKFAAPPRPVPERPDVTGSTAIRGGVDSIDATVSIR